MIDALLVWQFVHGGDRVEGGLVASVAASNRYSVIGLLETNWGGVRAAVLPLDALQRASGHVVVRVRLSGEITHHDADKIRSRHREVMWVADAGRVLREFAIWCADRALTGCRERGDEPHAASWRALEATRLWLDGKATEGELAAAKDAAWDAACDAGRVAANGFAANAAISAARAAAGASHLDAVFAASYAADSAAMAVGWAAGIASNEDAAGHVAWAAAEDAAADAAENPELDRRLLALAPATGGGVGTW